jgi:hypothetical protein
VRWGRICAVIADICAVWCGLISLYLLVAYGVARRHITSKRLASFTMVAILVSLLSTVINLSVLVILKGEHGLECLLCCSIDVLANAVALAGVTSNRVPEDAQSPNHSTESVSEKEWAA